MAMKKWQKAAVAGAAILTMSGVGASTFVNWGGEDNIDEIYRSVDHLDSMLTLKERARKEAKAEATRFEEQLKALEGEYNQNKEVVDSIKQELDLRQEHITLLENDLANYQGQIGTKDEDIARLQTTIEKQKTQLKEYADAHKNTLEQSQERINILESELVELREEHDNKLAYYEGLENEVASLNKQKDELQAENNRLNASNDENAEKLAKALNDVQDLEAYIKSIEANHEKSVD